MFWFLLTKLTPKPLHKSWKFMFYCFVIKFQLNQYFGKNAINNLWRHATKHVLNHLDKILKEFWTVQPSGGFLNILVFLNKSWQLKNLLKPHFLEIFVSKQHLLTLMASKRQQIISTGCNSHLMIIQLQVAISFKDIPNHIELFQTNFTISPNVTIPNQ